METIFKAIHLGKKYRKVESYALSDINLTQKRGEILGLIGPNGAGKSTFIKLLLGVLSQTEGSIECLGKDPKKFKTADKLKLGLFLGGKSNLYYHLPLRDSVIFFARLYNVPKNLIAHRLDKYARFLDCKGFLQQRVATLSLGQRLRAELLCLLIYEPHFLILDEPGIGMDIEGKCRFRQILRQLNRENGTTILLTSHDLLDLERVADRLAFIKAGRLIFDKDVSDLASLCQNYRVIKTDQILDGPFKLLEADELKYRYLVSNKTLELERPTIKEKSRYLYEESEANLEDVLYEYYR